MAIKKMIPLFLLLAVVCAPLNTSASDDAADGLFVVVTSPDPQTQLMAMVLSTQTLKKGKSVRVLLCSAGGDLALKDGKEVVLKPIEKSPQMLLKNLISKGVVVQVCPLYLPNREGSPSELIDGVTQAKPPLIADILLESGTKQLIF